MQSAFWMIVAAIIFAIYAVFIKLASFSGVDSFQILFYRSVFGLMLISTLMALRGISPLTQHPAGHAIRSLFGSAACVAGIYSISHLNIGLAMTLNYTSPLFLGAFVVGAGLVQRRPIYWRLISMVVLGFAGVVVLLSPTITPAEYPAACVGLSAGFCTAIAVAYVKRLGSLHEPELRIVFYFVLAGTLFGLVGSLWNGFAPLTLRNAAYLLAIALAANLAQLCITHAFSHGNLVLCGALQYCTILFSTVFGIVLFGDPVSVTSWLGMVTIAVAGILASLFTRQLARRGY